MKYTFKFRYLRVQERVVEHVDNYIAFEGTDLDNILDQWLDWKETHDSILMQNIRLQDIYRCDPYRPY